MTDSATQAFEFDLLFEVPADSVDPPALLDALFEAGCDDAVVGLGRPGHICLSFTRSGDCAKTAIAEAARSALGALPEGSTLRQAGSALDFLSDLPETSD